MSLLPFVLCEMNSGAKSGISTFIALPPGDKPIAVNKYIKKYKLNFYLNKRSFSDFFFTCTLNIIFNPFYFINL